MTTPLAAAIREARKTAGLTQVELARRLRVRQQTISDWETGRCIPGGAELACNGFAAKGYIQAAADFEAISDSMEEEIVRLRRLLAVATTRRRTA